MFIKAGADLTRTTRCDGTDLACLQEPPPLTARYSKQQALFSFFSRWKQIFTNMKTAYSLCTSYIPPPPGRRKATLSRAHVAFFLVVGAPPSTAVQVVFCFFFLGANMHVCLLKNEGGACWVEHP